MSETPKTGFLASRPNWNRIPQFGCCVLFADMLSYERAYEVRTVVFC